MIKGTMNQIANTGNPYQGDAQKVLCVCSAGLLRSPTLAQYLHKEYGYNTRCCGTAEEYALIPISEALVVWADTIIFVDKECKKYLSEDAFRKIHQKDTITLNIPDNYKYYEDILVEAIQGELQALGIRKYPHHEES